MRDERPGQSAGCDWDRESPPHVRCHSAREVATALGRGRCDVESDFDQFLPPEFRRVSGQHWTPLVVALRVADWLNGLGVGSVVDIGAGAGKFCVATALASGCEFVGIEQRPRLVEVARGLARTFGVEGRVRFVEGTLRQDLIPDADAYYLYNPFGENLLAPESRVDSDVELSESRFKRDVALMEELLERARVGTYVIKYNGFGGTMPASYEPIRVDREMPDVLRMWQKTGPDGGARYGSGHSQT